MSCSGGRVSVEGSGAVVAARVSVEGLGRLVSLTLKSVTALVKYN